MCLAVPVKVSELIDEKKVKVEVDGVKLEVSTAFTPDVTVGDYVLVHAGFVIEKLEEEDAKDKLELYKEYQIKTGQLK